MGISLCVSSTVAQQCSSRRASSPRASKGPLNVGKQVPSSVNNERTDRDSKHFSPRTTVQHWHGLKGLLKCAHTTSLQSLPLHLRTHTPHGSRSETGAVPGTRGIYECSGESPQWEAHQSSSRSHSLLSGHPGGHGFLHMGNPAHGIVQPPSPQSHTVQLLMENERKLNFMSDQHSCQRSHRIFNN